MRDSYVPSVVVSCAVCKVRCDVDGGIEDVSHEKRCDVIGWSEKRGVDSGKKRDANGRRAFPQGRKKT